MKKTILVILGLVLTIALLVGCTKTIPLSEQYSNTYGLDLSEKVELNIYGGQENFPGVEQVIAHFEKEFPNCNVNYIYKSEYKEALISLLSEEQTNKEVSLYLGTDDLFKLMQTGTTDKTTGEYTLEPIVKEGVSTYDDFALNYYDEQNTKIDINSIDREITAYGEIDEKLYAVPIAIDGRGMCVNKSLLAEYNLTVPTNWEQFLNCCKVMKEAGMTPIQCLPSHLGVCLIYPYTACQVVYDENYEQILAETNAFTEGSGQYFKDSFDKLIELCKPENAYFDVNAVADLEDNYEDAILNFFEGDVAFFPCTIEQYSGMKKRETLNDKAMGKVSSYDGFEYGYMGTPMGDSPSIYLMIYQGLTINPKCENFEWAKAFANYCFTNESLDTFAIEKGMLANKAVNNDPRFKDIASIEAPYTTHQDKFTITYFSEFKYTYEKIYKLDDRVYMLSEEEIESGVTCGDKAVAYFESKIKSKRK